MYYKKQYPLSGIKSKVKNFNTTIIKAKNLFENKTKMDSLNYNDSPIKDSPIKNSSNLIKKIKFTNGLS